MMAHDTCGGATVQTIVDTQREATVKNGPYNCRLPSQRFIVSSGHRLIVASAAHPLASGLYDSCQRLAMQTRTAHALHAVDAQQSQTGRRSSLESIIRHTSMPSGATPSFQFASSRNTSTSSRLRFHSPGCQASSTTSSSQELG